MNFWNKVAIKMLTFVVSLEDKSYQKGNEKMGPSCSGLLDENQDPIKVVSRQDMTIQHKVKTPIRNGRGLEIPQIYATTGTRYLTYDLRSKMLILDLFAKNLMPILLSILADDKLSRNIVLKTGKHGSKCN